MAKRKTPAHPTLPLPLPAAPAQRDALSAMPKSDATSPQVARKSAQKKRHKADIKPPKLGRRRPILWGVIYRRVRLVSKVSFICAILVSMAYAIHINLPGQMQAVAQNFMEDAARDAGAYVKHISVDGRQHTSRQDVLEAIGVLDQHTPIIALNAHAARQRLEKLPWVQQANVRIDYAGSVFVALQERIPVALWQRHSDFVLLDETGVVIEDDITKAANLPIIVGADAPQKVSDFLNLLRAVPEIAPRVQAGVRVGCLQGKQAAALLPSQSQKNVVIERLAFCRRWTLRLDNMTTGTDVYLPADQPEQALKRLIALDHTHNILSRDIKVIDLRYKRKVILQPNAPSGDSTPETLETDQPAGFDA
jgi:cell division protein FtsQ